MTCAHSADRATPAVESDHEPLGVDSRVALFPRPRAGFPVRPAFVDAGGVMRCWLVRINPSADTVHCRRIPDPAPAVDDAATIESWTTASWPAQHRRIRLSACRRLGQPAREDSSKPSLAPLFARVSCGHQAHAGFFAHPNMKGTPETNNSYLCISPDRMVRCLLLGSPPVHGVMRRRGAKVRITDAEAWPRLIHLLARHRARKLPLSAETTV
jgi:hypothetical protein